jgi:5-methylcytosine-specific restriction endonuclease McrA
MTKATKRCPRCGEAKPESAFGKNRANRDGLQSQCNTCRAAWRAENRAAIRAKDAAYAAAHREQAKARARAWRRNNPERARDRDRAYYQANKHRWPKRSTEQRRQTDRAYRLRRRDEAREYMAAYYLANPAKFIEYSNRRRALKRAAEGSARADQILARINYYGGKCWMCGAPWQEVDHVKPLAKGGSNWPANLRPICCSCNARKKARWYGAARLADLAR